MARDMGITTIGTVDQNPPLFYDEHASIDKTFTLALGQNIKRGDICFLNRLGRDYGDPVPGEANVGDGTVTITDVDENDTPEVITLTYQSGTSDWAVNGSVSGVISAGTDFSGGADAGPVDLTIAAGATAWADGDTFTINYYATGSLEGSKLTSVGDISDHVVVVAARDTDATNGPEPTFGYTTGVFNANAIGNWDDLITDMGGDDEEVYGALEKHGIIVKEGSK